MHVLNLVLVSPTISMALTLNERVHSSQANKPNIEYVLVHLCLTSKHSKQVGAQFLRANCPPVGSTTPLNKFKMVLTSSLPVAAAK